MTDFTVYCLKYGETTLPENMVFTGGDKNKKLPITLTFYLIKLRGRNILIDTGCDTMPGFVVKKHYSPAFVLRELDLCADEITDVVITHAHHDHIGAVSYFKNAVIHISEDALNSRSGYITDDMTVKTFQDEYIITPEIKVVKWGGHAAGSSIVEIKADDVTHIIAGDECYTNDCLVSGRPTGAYYNLDKAKEFVEKFKAKNYRVHTLHDCTLKTDRII